MVKFVLIDKTGNCKDSNITDINNIYKRCGLRNKKDFEKRITWKASTIYVSVFARKDGKANTENKFDMPPPIDNELYFGSIAVVGFKPNDDAETLVDFDVDKWCKVYEKLMGGFEELGSEDSEDEEIEEIPAELLTKHGYMKDSFIADSEEEEEGISADSEEEEESVSEHEYVTDDVSPGNGDDDIESEDDNNCSELSIEEYTDEDEKK